MRKLTYLPATVLPATMVALALLPACVAQDRFEGDVQRMLTADQSSGPPREGIEFIGSSIFRLWTGLREQMAPLPVFNRSFGGSRTQDLVKRAPQLVIPYRPKVIAYYCGSNDVNAGDSAEQILSRTKEFLRVVHEALPNTLVIYTAIQKAPDKRAHWDVVDAVNHEMERFSKESKNLWFVDLNPVLFQGGHLREDLFLPDELHFRPESSAYAEFTAVMRPVLEKAWAHVQ